MILTDGDNTMSHVNGALTSNVGTIDAQTRTACGLVKSNGVELFTVRLLKGNAALLKSCASDSNHYFDVQDAAQLKTAFQAFLDAVRGTRLTN